MKKKRGTGSILPDKGIEEIAIPDIVLPEIFHLGKNANLFQGEKRLMLAILEDAIDCYLKPKNENKNKLIFKKAEEWFMDDADGNIFSFGTICDVFDINAEVFRNRLLVLRKKRDRKGGPYSKILRFSKKGNSKKISA